MSSNERTMFVAMPSASGTLIGIAGTIAGRKFPLSAGTFLIGRDAECELALAAEPGVSRQHAKIVAEADDYVVQDCESRNGTLVNGKPVQKQRLKHGDIISICGAQFRFERGGGGSDSTQIYVPPPGSNYPGAAPLGVPHTPSPIQGPPSSALPPGAGAPMLVRQPELSSSRPSPTPARRGPPPVFFIAGGVTLVIGLAAVATAVVFGKDGPPELASGDVGLVPSQAADAGASAATNGPDPAAMGTATADAGVGGATTTTASTGTIASDAGPSPATDPTPPVNAAVSEGFTPVTPLDLAGEAVRSKSSGKVVEVSAENGATVKKGDPLFIVEGEADRAKIATLKESIAALREVAEANDRAKKQLEQDKAELARLQSMKAKVTVTAPSDGILGEFALSPGAAVKAGDLVAKIQPPTKVIFPITSKPPVVGSTCAINTASGMKFATVFTSTAKDVTLTLPADVPASSVLGARCN